MSLRSCSSSVQLCSRRLLLQHNSITIARHKYTAPRLDEVVNKKRAKFSAFQQHRAEDVSKVETTTSYPTQCFVTKSARIRIIRGPLDSDLHGGCRRR